MDLSYSDEQRAIRDVFAAFSDGEIRPAAADLDQNPRFPRELFEKAGDLGFFEMRYGGADIHSYLLAVEELARGSLGVAAACTMQSLMGTFFLHRFARDSVRERLFAPAMRGEIVGTICMTEPDAGSDLMAMTTRAEETDGTWHITGQKTWITSAPVADMFTVFARTGEGERELSVLLVERGADGLSLGRNIEKMGVRASVTSEVFFENTPATCLLGEPGKGVSYLREILVEIRLMTAALALGVARAAHEDSLRYAHERTQFGKPIAKFQAIQAHLAENATELEAARCLIRYAAWRSEQGMENEAQANMAKLFCSEAAYRICERAARVLASYGFATDYAIERYLRDVRFTLIGGGTSEILKINIARGLVR